MISRGKIATAGRTRLQAVGAFSGQRAASKAYASDASSPQNPLSLQTIPDPDRPLVSSKNRDIGVTHYSALLVR